MCNCNISKFLHLFPRFTSETTNKGEIHLPLSFPPWRRKKISPFKSCRVLNMFALLDCTEGHVSLPACPQGDPWTMSGDLSGFPRSINAVSSRNLQEPTDSGGCAPRPVSSTSSPQAVWESHPGEDAFPIRQWKS